MAADDARQQRLKLALRENLKRRKEQARARGEQTPAPEDTDNGDSADKPDQKGWPGPDQKGWPGPDQKGWPGPDQKGWPGPDQKGWPGPDTGSSTAPD